MTDNIRPGQAAESTEIVDDGDVEEMLYARHVEVENFRDLETQRGTPIPALFNQFYKFVQNPSSVSVETYKRMVDTDDTVGSGVDFLTTCLAARVGDYLHPSKEVTEWVNRNLEEMEGGFTAALKELLSATWVGYSVAEKVWANTDDGFVIKKLVSMPPSTLLFETERTGEITYDGILQYQRNFNPALMGQGVGHFGGSFGTGLGFTDGSRPDLFAKLGDLPFPLRTANTWNYMSIRIPRLKCIHYAFDAQGKFGNPYGRSLLRRAYKYYVMKDAFLQMLAVALDRKGTPLTVVFADNNTTLIDPEKASQGVNAKGNENIGIRADEAARRAFAKIHVDSSIILPGKKDQIFGIETIQNQADSQTFISALDFCNKSIMRALLIPSLIFGNGDGSGSYSLGQEHARTFDKILDGMLAGLLQTLRMQMIKEMIAYNFPESVWKKEGLGGFTKRQLTQDEREKEMQVYEKAIDKGIVDANDMNDLNKMRDTIGFEPRETPIPPKVPMGGMFGENPLGDNKDGDNDEQ